MTPTRVPIQRSAARHLVDEWARTHGRLLACGISNHPEMGVPPGAGRCPPSGRRASKSWRCNNVTVSEKWLSVLTE